MVGLDGIATRGIEVDTDPHRDASAPQAMSQSACTTEEVDSSER